MIDAAEYRKYIASLKVHRVPLSVVDVVDSELPRKLDEGYAQNCADREGAFPPIVVKGIPPLNPPFSDGELTLIEGRHRLRAAEIRGETVIPVVIDDRAPNGIDYIYPRAIVLGSDSKRQFSLPVMRAAANRLYTNEPFATKPTVTALAEIVGAPRRTVADWLKETLEVHSEIRRVLLMGHLLMKAKQATIAKEFGVTRQAVGLEIKAIDEDTRARIGGLAETCPEDMRRNFVANFDTCIDRFEMEHGILDLWKCRGGWPVRDQSLCRRHVNQAG